MAYPQKWICPVTTPVRIEKAYKNLAEVLEIEFTTAANAGLELLIEDRLGNISDPKITPEMVKEFREVKNHHLKEIELSLHRKAILEEKAKQLEEKKAVIKEQIRALVKPIRVWDLEEEAYKIIPECEFNAVIHQKVKA